MISDDVAAAEVVVFVVVAVVAVDVTSQSVWPDVGIKLAQLYPKLTKTVAMVIFTDKWRFSKYAK